MNSKRFSSCRFLLLSTFIMLLACTAWAQIPSPDKSPSEMSMLDAAILGIVEGLTEYLPVSSTGHLILTQKAMGIGTESEQAKTAADAYAICIQAGAILAVLGIYFSHVKQMGNGLIGRDPQGKKLFINLIVAFIPAAIVGLLLDDYIEQFLFGLIPTTFAWFVGGIVILIVSHKRKNTPSTQGNPITSITAQQAIIIGSMQCIAMWPGTSRSLVTILAGIMVGLSLTAAVEFSFLLGVVTLTAATAYKTLQHGDLMLQTYGIGPLVVGFIAATISAIFAVKWMVGYLNKNGLAIFGHYRIILAIIVGTLFAMKIIAD